MRPFGDLTRFEEARRVALELCVPVVGAERITLGQAHGRVLASAVESPFDVPGSDRAAMDGFAVIASDVGNADPAAPALLDPVGRILAGQVGDGTLLPGQCIEIATGAQLPPGADAVVPVEMTEERDGRIAVMEPAGAGSHIARRGEDLAVGDVVGPADRTVTPAIAAALASVGIESVEVRRRPRVLLVPNGDELAPLGAELVAGQVYDSNSVGVGLVATASGASVERIDIVRDSAAALVEGLEQQGFDLVVTLGGTSVGRHDLVLDVVEGMGEVLVHGIAIKPGKPVLLARVGNTPVVGLPGFPTSCLMTSYLFVEPMIRTLAGLAVDHRPRVLAVLDEGVRSPGEKLQFLTVSVDDGVATPVFRASSRMTSMSAADGWIEIPVGVSEIPASTPVDVTLF